MMRVVATIFLLCFALFYVPCARANDHKVTTRSAIFAGGCFWCMEADFDKLPGVIRTISGYTGGHLENPNYESVSRGDTGHYEAVKVIYDPQIINYKKLLQYYWHHIDPTDAKGQFCDKGSEYRSAIFYANDSERKLSEMSRNKLIQSGQFNKIYTNILPFQTFYPAESYHQNFYSKNPLKYKYYRYRCGRDKKVQDVWRKIEA